MCCTKQHRIALSSTSHLRSDSVPLRGGVVIRPRLDLGVEAVLVLVPEGRVAHQQDVQDHPCNVTMPPPLLVKTLIFAEDVVMASWQLPFQQQKTCGPVPWKIETDLTSDERTRGKPGIKCNDNTSVKIKIIPVCAS